MQSIYMNVLYHYVHDVTKQVHGFMFEHMIDMFGVHGFVMSLN